MDVSVNTQYNYIDAGIGGLVLRSAGEPALQILGSGNGAQTGNVVVYNDVNVIGTLTVGGQAITTSNPFWVAGRINGTDVTVLTSKGRHGFTVTRSQTGFFRVSWTTPHPDGDNFIVVCQGEGVGGNTWNILPNANTTTLANSATDVHFVVRDHNFDSVNGNINFMILA